MEVAWWHQAGGVGRPCAAALDADALDAILRNETKWDGVRALMRDVWRGHKEDPRKVLPPALAGVHLTGKCAAMRGGRMLSGKCAGWNEQTSRPPKGPPRGPPNTLLRWGWQPAGRGL